MIVQCQQQLDASTHTKQRPDGWTGRNRIMRYGYDYDCERWLGDWPEWIDPLTGPERRGRIDMLGVIPPDASFNSVTINEYLPGNIIRPHIDSLSFGPAIWILNLGSNSKMSFAQVDEKTKLTGRLEIVDIPRRSLTVMTGEARYEWEHSAFAQQQTRYSIVFREKILKKSSIT